MKAELNTTPTQYASLARENKQRSQLWPHRRRMLKPVEPGEKSEFQKELDACMKTWEK